MPTYPWKRRVAALAAGLLTGALVSGPVLAQGPSRQKPPAQSAPEPAENVTDQEINQVAAVVTKLQHIKESYSEEMGQAKNKEQAHQIQTEMQQEMQQAIEAEGLSIKRYRKIIAAVQQDSKLHQKLLQRLQDQGMK